MAHPSLRSWLFPSAVLAGIASACSSAPVTPSQPLATAAPTASAVPILACEKGTADCDRKPGNACETRLDDSQQHCGACGKACDLSERCVRGACVRASPLVAREGTTCLAQTLGPGATKSRVFCWGRQVPRGEGIWGESPVPVEIPDLAGARALSVAGSPKGCAVTAAGRAACWVFGAVRDIDALDDVVSVGMNDLSDTACAVLRSGAVQCTDSLAGEEETITATVPGLRDAISISSNEEYTCALLRSGKVACWEDAYAASVGSSGAGGEDPRRKPIQPILVQGLRGAVQLESAGSRSCAVTGDGAVACWGARSFDELYDASVGPFVAVPVAGLTDAAEVAVGVLHACAVRKAGGVVCWGSNIEGQLGVNVSGSADAPLPVEGLEDAIHVAAGDEHTCAQRRSGAVHCWGSASEGRLGNGTTAHHASPVEVAGIEDAAWVAADGKRTCAVRKGGQVECWGKGLFDSISDPGKRAIPPSPMPGFDGAVSLSLANRLECVATKAGEVVCAEADSSSGRRRGAANGASPSAVLPNLRAARAVALDGVLGVALLGGGKAELWDARAFEASLGSKPDTPKDDTKIRTLSIPGLSDGVEVAIEPSTVCFRRRSGRVACARHVGSDTFNRGFVQSAGKLTDVPDVRDAVQIAATKGKFCAVRKTGAVVCFNADGFPLPAGVKGLQRPLVVQPSEGIAGAVAVVMGYSFTCALLSSGKVSCSGNNYLGELGCGDFERHDRPMLVEGLEDAVSIAAGSRYACAVRKTGRVVCWGSNEGDGAGHPDPPVSLRPVEVKGVLAAER